jgi:hypothetical protein
MINVDFLLKRIFIDNLGSLNGPGEMKFIHKLTTVLFPVKEK